MVALCPKTLGRGDGETHFLRPPLSSKNKRFLGLKMNKFMNIKHMETASPLSNLDCLPKKRSNPQKLKRCGMGGGLESRKHLQFLRGS